MTPRWVAACITHVHLFTPTGGLGYNTAVEDAANLGWELAAVIHGWGGPALLATYETERQAIAKCNTGYARGFADSIGLYVPPAELEDDSPQGATARKAAGDYLNAQPSSARDIIAFPEMALCIITTNVALRELRGH